MKFLRNIEKLPIQIWWNQLLIYQILGIDKACIDSKVYSGSKPDSITLHTEKINSGLYMRKWWKQAANADTRLIRTTDAIILESNQQLLHTHGTKGWE
jgi:hypothetical protein